MSTLVLLRHGQSVWNLENRFTGWSDVLLTDQGRKDAGTAGEHLRDIAYDLAFTSRLARAQQTLEAVLYAAGQADLPVEKDSALNERHYGDLQGLNKAETATKYGQDQVHLWRRSYDTRPPNGESIADCARRVTPFFLQYILPLVQQGKNVLVAAHGNSLRPILQYLDKLENDQTAELEIGLCTPYIYTFEGERMVKKEIREIPGIVTKGASTTETSVESGRV
jgi:2,3-bisphosphoglycerate-dependent phosphoglycerate mutase